MTGSLAIGLAALGRPEDLTLGHGDDLGTDDVARLRDHAHEVLDAAWDLRVRHVDADTVAADLGVGPDVVATAAAMAQPWADVVLSGPRSPGAEPQTSASRTARAQTTTARAPGSAVPFARSPR